MELDEFLQPVAFELRELKACQNESLIGNYVRWALDDDFEKGSIVILSFPEYRDYTGEVGEVDEAFQSFRHSLYNMVKSNWRKPLYDLGTILPGETIEDSYFALHQVLSVLSENKAQVILLGGSQAMTFIAYQSAKKKLLNIGTIDYKLDISADMDSLHSDNFISKMILDENPRLLEYVNLGSQAPYNPLESLDVLEQLNFENIRLGKLSEDLSEAEPYIRELDLLSVDMNAMQKSSFDALENINPNGLNEREICGLMRYGGLSKTLYQLIIANYQPKKNDKNSGLIAEMVWYFIEGKNNQKREGRFETFRVQFDEHEVVFVKSRSSERWWIEVFVDGMIKRVPCSEKDYRSTLNDEIPRRWLRFFKKYY